MLGFTWSAITRMDKADFKELQQFIRGEQMRRLKEFCKNKNRNVNTICDII